MMNKKSPLSTVLFVLLFIGGLGMLFYPKLSDLYFRWQISRELARYQQVIEADHSAEAALLAEAEAYNRDLAQKEDQLKLEPGEMERISGLLNPLGNHMMGTISIPKIHEELPVYQGIEEKQLQSGAGWIFGTSLPTGGENTHCVITAHNGLVKAKMFTDVDKLVVGDRFSMKVLNREMTYEVDKILVTKPNDFSGLLIVPGEDLMTLYTCTPYGINTDRLLVRGHRVETAGTPNAQPVNWKLLLGLALLLLILTLVWAARKRQRQGLQDKPGETV